LEVCAATHILLILQMTAGALIKVLQELMNVTWKATRMMQIQEYHLRISWRFLCLTEIDLRNFSHLYHISMTF